MLLPEPFSPTTEWSSPGRNSNEQSTKALVIPKVFDKCFTSSASEPAEPDRLGGVLLGALGTLASVIGCPVRAVVSVLYLSSARR